MAIGIMDTSYILGLLTELRASTDFYNEQDENWPALLCNMTKKETVRWPQRTTSFRPVGEGGTPLRQRIDYQEVEIPEPIRYGIGSAITQKALEDGLDEEQVRQNHTDILNADYRLMTRLCTRAMLSDGGWWDGTATPPRWAENLFTAGHSHYMADGTVDTPTLEHWSAIKRHIQEHGFGRGAGVIACINGDMAMRIVNTAEYVQDPQPMPTRTMETLQWLGLTPSFRAAGVYITETDWVPDPYIMAWAIGEKPLHWRIPDGMDSNILLTWEQPEDVRIKGNFDYIRRGNTAVTLRGAGVAMVLDSAAWVDPDIQLID